MNRVSHLGPIDLDSKWSKPPEPPIILGNAADDRPPFVLAICNACSARPFIVYDVTTTPYTEVESDKTIRVELRREHLRFIMYSPLKDANDWQSVLAYIGQCERCQRIYIITVS